MHIIRLIPIKEYFLEGFFFEAIQRTLIICFQVDFLLMFSLVLAMNKRSLFVCISFKLLKEALDGQYFVQSD